MYAHTLRRVLSLATFLAVLLSLFSHSPARANTPADQTGPTPEQANRTLYLPLLATGTLPSSDQLIDDALARGEINQETALIYHTFAVFGDPRLPAAYRGDGTTKREITAELAEQYESLSASAKETLAPFLLPPYHVGSWWDVQQAQRQGRVAPSATVQRCEVKDDSNNRIVDGWAYIDSEVGNIRVWWQTRYPEDAAKAKRMAQDAEMMWTKLAALMGRTPPSDNGSKTPCRGGSNHYDISLLDLKNLGEAQWHKYVSNKSNSSHILLGRTAENDTLIHELMHAFQYAYPQKAAWKEYAWWAEATATWAEHYVFPSLNSEHPFAEDFLQRPDMSLEETLPNGGSNYGRAHQYGAYLFAWFIASNIGDQWIRTSWERFGTETNSLKAINGLIPGGFSEQWPRFVLRMLNRPPMDDFKKADQLEHRVKFESDWNARLNGTTDFSYELKGDVKHLASRHYRFVFNDETVRSVAFFNPVFDQPQKTARIQALLKIDGQWKQEDWTEVPLRSFCRDVKAERIEELMVVFSNHEWNDRNHKLSYQKPPRLNITNVACRGWEFEVNGTMRIDEEDHQVTETTVATGRWERHFVPEDPGGSRIFEFYQAHNVKVNWKHTGVEGNCSANGSGSVVVRGGEYTSLAVWNNALSQSGLEYVPNRRVYHGTGTDYDSVLATKVTYTCEGGAKRSIPVEMLSRWFLTETLPTQSVSADGTHINGSFTTRIQDKLVTYTWKMTALPPE